MNPNAKSESRRVEKLKTFKLDHANPAKECKVNLFRETAFFNDYTEIYGEIMKVNAEALKCYDDYKLLVDSIRNASKGIPYGMGMKIPKKESDQFKVILRIF